MLLGHQSVNSQSHKGRGGRLRKEILYRDGLTQIYKNCADNLETGCWTQEKKLRVEKKKLHVLYRPRPPIFLFTSGSINNTNAKYSKNFFFSLAHTENTG